MIELPDKDKAFHYENNFFLSCDKSRISKFIAQYTLFNMSKDVEGDIIECGVFKGCSLVNLLTFRDILGLNKKVIAFDTFSKYPETCFERDKNIRNRFIEESGDESIGKDQLISILENKGITNYELIEGDILETVPQYVEDNPELKISLLNLDVDIYEPSKVILEYLYPKLSDKGILILDDFNVFPGETKATYDYFKNEVTINRFEYRDTPYYVIKNE